MNSLEEQNAADLDALGKRERTGVYDVHAQQKYRILLKISDTMIGSMNSLKGSIDQVRKTVESATASQTSLSGKIYSLNRILTWATVVGAIATAVLAIDPIMSLINSFVDNTPSP